MVFPFTQQFTGQSAHWRDKTNISLRFRPHLSAFSSLCMEEAEVFFQAQLCQEVSTPATCHCASMRLLTPYAARPTVLALSNPLLREKKTKTQTTKQTKTQNPQTNKQTKTKNKIKKQNQKNTRTKQNLHHNQTRKKSQTNFKSLNSN